jgi:hypothetical protein
VLGCLAALSRFISRLGEKGLPLYRLLKKHERFSWTAEAEDALDKLKASLTHAPILTPPQDGEPLQLYVVATTQVVSAVIVVERTEEGHALPVQRSVYYISEVLSDTKTRYPQVQKLLYAVVLARRKVRHYFEAHPVTVVSSFSLGGNHPQPGRGGQNRQVVSGVDGRDTRLHPAQGHQVPDPGGFRRRVDGHATAAAADPGRVLDSVFRRLGDEDRGGRGPALRVTSRGTHAVRSTSPLPPSNNMAEYEALLCGLKIAIEIGVKRLDVRGDSQLVIDQVMKNVSCHDDKMEAYCRAVRALEDKF